MAAVALIICVMVCVIPRTRGSQHKNDASRAIARIPSHGPTSKKNGLLHSVDDSISSVARDGACIRTPTQYRSGFPATIKNGGGPGRAGSGARAAPGP